MASVFHAAFLRKSSMLPRPGDDVTDFYYIPRRYSPHLERRLVAREILEAFVDDFSRGAEYAAPSRRTS